MILVILRVSCLHYILDHHPKRTYYETRQQGLSGILGQSLRRLAVELLQFIIRTYHVKREMVIGKTTSTTHLSPVTLLAGKIQTIWFRREE